MASGDAMPVAAKRLALDGRLYPNKQWLHLTSRHDQLVTYNMQATHTVCTKVLTLQKEVRVHLSRTRMYE